MVVYICFCKMTSDFLKKPIEEREQIIPQWMELGKKHGLKTLTYGNPTGVNENVVIMFQSKKYSDNYMKFQREWLGLGSPEAHKFVEHTRTITVH